MHSAPHRTNIEGTQNLLDECRAHPNVQRFVFISTDEVYGTLPLDRPDLLFTEESPFDPSSPYAASKVWSAPDAPLWSTDSEEGLKPPTEQKG